jgi:hypothetical protein
VIEAYKQHVDRTLLRENLKRSPAERVRALMRDPPTLQRGLNFTLTTSLGPLDLLGEIIGGGTYEELLPDTAEVELFGRRCRVLALAALIRAKRVSAASSPFTSRPASSPSRASHHLNSGERPNLRKASPVPGPRRT